MMPGVAAVVRNDAGEILLGRRSDDGSWDLPAGAVEPGEQPADAVLREVFEETGVVAEIDRIGGVASEYVEYVNGDVCQYLTVWFSCRAVGGEARVNDDESTEVGWFAPDTLPVVSALTRHRLDTTAVATDPTWFVPAAAAHPIFAFPA